MTLSQLSTDRLAQLLTTTGLFFRTGPFIVCLQSPIQTIAEGIQVLYPNFLLEESTAYADFHIMVKRSSGIRRWFRPQVIFSFDGYEPFRPLPLSQALPVFEWGLNWCIASNAHQYLMIHSAVIEKNGQAVILAAPPGSGKSTLCAGLVSRGWRLLSDEMALVDRKTGEITPVPRPISLKDESIEIMRDFQADAVIGPLSKDTSKGTVAHLRPPVDSVKRDMESVKARFVIFPKYQRGAPTSMVAQSKAKSCISLANNCFNYHILGEAGFHLLGGVIDECDCFEFCYSQLDEAIPVFDTLVSN